MRLETQLVIDRKSPKCLRDLLESLLDTSLVSRMAKDESITERSTVRGSTGILNILKGYFVEDSSQQQDNIRPLSTNRGADNHSEEGQRKDHGGDSTSVSQYQNWTTVELSNPVQSAWIFQAYLVLKDPGGGCGSPSVRRSPAISHRIMLWLQNFLTLSINIPTRSW